MLEGAWQTADSILIGCFFLYLMTPFVLSEPPALHPTCVLAMYQNGFEHIAKLLSFLIDSQKHYFQNVVHSKYVANHSFFYVISLCDKGFFSYIGTLVLVPIRTVLTYFLLVTKHNSTAPAIVPGDVPLRSLHTSFLVISSRHWKKNNFPK